jgi:phage regulator Rha-like protein
MLTLTTTAATMTSREIADLVEKRHDNVVRTINTLVNSDLITPPQFEEVPNDGPGPAMIRQYRLGKRASIIVVAQLCPEFTARLVDRWQELELAAAVPANPYANLPPEQQALISVMLDNASIKAVQAEQGAAILAIGQRVDEAAQTQLLMERPTAAESIVHIRARIGKLYGLPARIIDQIIRQSPYAPKPAGMVKNQREEAQGSSYAVYWIKDVSTVFARFVRECVHQTATQATHPLVDGRFKLDREH